MESSPGAQVCKVLFRSWDGRAATSFARLLNAQRAQIWGEGGGWIQSQVQYEAEANMKYCTS